jgi:hypothetical protein
VLSANYAEAEGAPRTVSTKAAFAWYALHPGPYATLAMRQVVAAARQDRLWAAGITESGLAPLGAPNINTSAVILQAVLYARDGVPLLERARLRASAAGSESGPAGSGARVPQASGISDAAP